MHPLSIILIYFLLEISWLTLMKTFYISQYKSIISKKLLVRNWLAVILCYILLIIGIFKFATNIISGALFGLCVYGIYNMTNLALLPGYSWTLAIVDTLWGMTIFSIIGWLQMK